MAVSDRNPLTRLMSETCGPRGARSSSGFATVRKAGALRCSRGARRGDERPRPRLARADARQASASCAPEARHGLLGALLRQARCARRSQCCARARAPTAGRGAHVDAVFDSQARQRVRFQHLRAPVGGGGERSAPAREGRMDTSAAAAARGARSMHAGGRALQPRRGRGAHLVVDEPVVPLRCSRGAGFADFVRCSHSWPFLERWWGTRAPHPFMGGSLIFPCAPATVAWPLHGSR